MSIKILFDNYNNECFSGQTISGHIECNFTSKKTFKAITIKLEGCAKIKWNEKSSIYNPATRKTVVKTFPQYAEETYINVENFLVGGSEENVTLPRGKHTYPFSYALPENLPSSFQGSEGKVRYYIHATVIRPWKFNYNAKVPLNVVLPMDLNYIPNLRIPVALSDNTNIRSCCFRKSGLVTFNLSVPVTGYVPGQEINIKGYIQNLTNITVTCTKFKVVADYEYITHHPKTSKRVSSIVIVKCSEGKVGAYSEKTWISTLLLPIDHLYPNLTTCNLINVRYSVKAEVVLPGSNNNLQLEFPITIGSIALSDASTAIADPPAQVDPALAQYASLNNPNAPYHEMYGDSLPPPYSLRNEKLPNAPIDEQSPHSFGTNALPPGFIHSTPLPEKSGGSIPYSSAIGGSAPYPLSDGASAPYLPTFGGSAPYLPLADGPALYLSSAGGSAPYLSSAGGSAPYPPSAGGSASYLSSAGGSAPYPSSGAGSAPYLPSAGGSAPYPSPAGGSALYLPSTSTSAPYPPLSGGSDPYLPPAGGSAPYPSLSVESTSYSSLPEKTDLSSLDINRSESNPEDKTASAPPPPYEEVTKT